MSVAFDAASNSPSATGNLSWTHTPTSTPRGVLVLIAQEGSAADQINSVTYGGVAMTRVAFAQDTTGEPGAAYAYFLGAGVPTGAQTVQVTVSGAGVKRPVALTVTEAATDTEVETFATLQENQANPSMVLATGVGVECFCAGVLFSGHDSATNVTDGADYTSVLAHGFGGRIAKWVRRTNNSTGGNVTMDWTATSEDVAAVGVAIRAASAGGEPEPPGPGQFPPFFLRP